MNTHRSHFPQRMPNLGSLSTDSGSVIEGISAAEISAIIQAQRAYAQSITPSNDRGMLRFESEDMPGRSSISAMDAVRARFTQIEAGKETGDLRSGSQSSEMNSIYDRLTEAANRLTEAQKEIGGSAAQAADALQTKALWMREFHRLQDAGASDDKTGAEGATEKTKSLEKAQQDRHAQSYARLVSARDGAADTARVASAAHEDRLHHTQSHSFDELRKDMNRNHTEATQAVTRKNYSRK